MHPDNLILYVHMQSVQENRTRRRKDEELVRVFHLVVGLAYCI